MPALLKMLTPKTQSTRNALPQLALILFLCLCSFIFLLKSPMHFWLDSDAGTDQSVFQTVALMMQKGYMPYLDSFDHKGPLIYLINYWGMMINKRHGIWIIEFIAIWVTYAAIYKIARLYCSKVFSCILVLTSAMLLADYFKHGNLTEEYAMPFIGVSLYIFLDFLISQKTNAFRLFLCGFGFGAVMMLRPNMISVWLVFCTAVLTDCLRRRLFLDLLIYLLFFLVGACIITIPIIIWLAHRHALSAFIEQYFLFNFLYSSTGMGASLSTKLACVLTFLNPFVYSSQLLTITAIISCVFLCLKRERFLYGVYAMYLLITLLLMCMSGYPFNHYGMILVPAIVFPMASFYQFMLSRRRYAFCMLCIFLLGGITLPGWFSSLKDMPGIYKAKNEEHHSDIVLSICQIIAETSSPEDCISVFGNWNLIYVLSDRRHATKYSYQFPIGQVSPAIMESYYSELAEELPMLIILQSERSDPRMDSFLKAHGYEEIWREEISDPSQIPAKVLKRAGI